MPWQLTLERSTYTVVTAAPVAGLVLDQQGASNAHQGLCGSAGRQGVPCALGGSETTFNFTTHDTVPPAVLRDPAREPLFACSDTANGTQLEDPTSTRTHTHTPTHTHTGLGW